MYNLDPLLIPYGLNTQLTVDGRQRQTFGMYYFHRCPVRVNLRSKIRYDKIIGSQDALKVPTIMGSTLKDYTKKNYHFRDEINIYG